MFDFLKKKEISAKKNSFICPGAFSQVNIYPDGRVFLCPDCMVTPAAQIGNLNKDSFKKIYNSKIAQQIRREILDGKYTMCNPRQCFSKSNYGYICMPSKAADYSVKQKKFPKMVSLGPDAECNINCVMCRKDISRLSDDELKNYNEKIYKWYLPILKDAEELTLSATSDPFASRNTRLLMKEAANKYKNLKFNILTNGILFDKYNCDDVGITDRLVNVMFSIHGSNEETYNKIAGNGNFHKVQENLEWASSMKQQGKIKGLYAAFVISSKNYYDIPNFIEFAKAHNAVALFWPCVDWGGNLSNADEPLSVVNPSNPKFMDFMEIIKPLELETEYSHFSFNIRLMQAKYNISHN